MEFFPCSDIGHRARSSGILQSHSFINGAQHILYPPTRGKVDLTQSAYDNDMIHNRWHSDIPMVAWVNPGDDSIVETYDWTGGFIKNNDSADDVRDIDLSIVHFLSGPIGVKGAEPGDLLVGDLLDVGPMKDSQWGFNGFFSKQNGGGFLTDHFPEAQKSIWDFKGMYTSSPPARDEHLMRHADKISCKSRNERMWADGEPRCPPSTCTILAGRLRCQKCAKAGERPVATLLQLAPRVRHAATE